MEPQTHPERRTSEPALRKTYRETVVPLMMKEFNYSNSMAVPRVEKVVVNMGVKEGGTDVKILERLSAELAQITGQRPIVRRAKKAISSFKLRQGAPIGLKVTLRQKRMYDFMTRLFNVAMPRIRDFRGFPDANFDGTANISIGLQEQFIFPEVEYEKIQKVQGMDITFVTSCTDKGPAKRLLELLGFPFRK